MSSITLKDFQPWNQWSGRCYSKDKNDNEYMADRDKSTNRVYMYQDEDTLRVKCGALLLWSVAAHVCRIAITTFFIITFHQFSFHYQGEPNEFGYCTMVHYSLKERITEMGKDVLKILATPALILFLESAAFYGLFNPLDGRKLYASVERFAYEIFGMEGMDLFDRPAPAFCAPCFQPESTRHALGGNPLNGNAW